MGKHISRPEKAICFYLKKFFLVEENKLIDEKHMELDMYVPSINLAIEYDGRTWHQHVKRDLLKDEYCRTHNIELIRIREKGTPFYQTTAKVILTEEPDLSLRFLNPVLQDLFVYINEKYGYTIPTKYDIDQDYYSILSEIDKYDFENSLALKFPNLAKEWDYERNGELRPENISSGSSVKVWWKCKNGHEWKTSIGNRTNSSNLNKCPYCQRKRVIVGENDIMTLKCDFLKDWDYSKNPISPDQYMKNSGKKVWWKCSDCGNEWEASVDQRSKHGCRYCSRKKAWEHRRKGDRIN